MVHRAKLMVHRRKNGISVFQVPKNGISVFQFARESIFRFINNLTFLGGGGGSVLDDYHGPTANPDGSLKDDSLLAVRQRVQEHLLAGR